MSMQTEENLPSFEAISLKTAKFLSYSYSVIMLMGILMMIIMPFVMIFMGSVTEELLFLIIFLFVPLLLLMIYNFKKKHSYTTISINDKGGGNYLNKFNGEVVKEICWADFESIKKISGSISFLDPKTYF